MDEKAVKKEWSRYGFEGPKDRSAVPFDAVFHTSHLRDALRIFEDGVIRSSLVWDESRLRDTRTCVAWASPNEWINGSIYGSIRFSFAWKDIIEGSKLYWVEDVRKYNPPAYRMLVSWKSQPYLPLYNAKRSGGPVAYDPESSTWYRHMDYTGEFLVDDDLRLEDCLRVDFVDHHAVHCRKDQSNCRHLGARGRAVGARFLAGLVGNRFPRNNALFLEAGSKERRFHRSVADAWFHLRGRLSVQKHARGAITASHPAAMVLVSAILHRFSREGSESKGLTSLCNLFRDTEELRSALSHRIRKAFKVSRQALEPEND